MKVMVNTKKSGFILVVALLLSALAVISMSSCGAGQASPSKKVIVLGIDGMDPNILEKMMAEGKMPNFSKLAKQGGYSRLDSSIPPQSPVAWSDFITGMDPGGHGIFDFIHREPENYMPYLSTSKTEGAGRSISLGEWVLPLSGGETKLLRKGKAFWQILEENGVPTTIIKIPANFPPAESPGRSISGMGTPDILGTYGTFSFFTDAPERFEDDISGGKVYPVDIEQNVVNAKLLGPKNTFKKDQPTLEVDFTVYIDSENPVAKIKIDDEEILLNVGEWSDWVSVEFEAVPYLQSLKGICRLYLKEVRPHFGLYISPVNIDPLDPALPISTPDDYAAKLAKRSAATTRRACPRTPKRSRPMCSAWKVTCCRRRSSVVSASSCMTGFSKISIPVCSSSTSAASTRTRTCSGG
jgi:hypothetical protein